MSSREPRKKYDAPHAVGLGSAPIQKGTVVVDHVIAPVAELDTAAF